MDFYPFNHPGLVLRDEHRAVIHTSIGHLCGYVALPATSIPAQWHGNYEADALQYLDIHGGITYASVGGGDDAQRKLKEKEAVDWCNASCAANEPVDKIMGRMKLLLESQLKAQLSVPYEYVIFGFDCDHFDDDQNDSLRDPQYVMELVRRMEQQLTSYAARIDEWRAADRERRIAMIDEIRGCALMNMGLGAMIGMLSGAPEFGPS